MKKWKKLAAAAVIGTAALAALSLGGCAKKEQGTIKIASKPMTEQYVLTEIIGQLIEHDLGVKVEFLDNAPPLQDALSDFFQRKKSGL